MTDKQNGQPQFRPLSFRLGEEVPCNGEVVAYTNQAIGTNFLGRITLFTASGEPPPQPNLDSLLQYPGLHCTVPLPGVPQSLVFNVMPYGQLNSSTGAMVPFNDSPPWRLRF